MKTLLTLSIIIIFLGGLFAQNDEATLDSVSREVASDVETIPTQIPQTTVTGERDVYFLHGLGGDATSWNLTSEYLENNFKLTRTVPVYQDYTNGNLETAAKKVHDEINIMNAAPINPNTAIMIGHSQGGMVAKSLDRLGRITLIPKYQQQHYNGIVTFGSPHLGAELLSKSLATGGNGEFEAFLDDGCNKLGHAAIDNLISEKWLADLVFDYTGFTTYLNSNLPSSLCYAFTNTAIPILAAQFVKPINQDYKVNSPVVNTLNTYNTNVPIVNFYGEETQPVMFRLMSSLDADEGNITPSNPFTANDDSKYVVATINMMNEFNSISISKSAQAARLKINAINLMTNPLTLLLGIILNERSNDKKLSSIANHNAAMWLHGANNRWLELIGAQQTLIDTSEFCECSYAKIGKPEMGSMGLFTTKDPASVNCNVTNGTVTVYRFTTPTPGLPNECDCEYYDSPLKTNRLFVQKEYISNCPNDGSYTVFQMNKLCNNSVYYNAYKYLETNDGLVLSSSGAGYPAAVARIRMDETNHFQMRNCLETKDKIEDLFDKRIPNTTFFHTDYR